MSAPNSSALEDAWQFARLIPTAGIRGQVEQEARATSALLAVLAAVPAFGKALLKPLGAPSGTVSTFTEVRLEGDDDRRHIPDGAIVIKNGSKRWSCLVEVKTATVDLQSEQVIRYLDVARRHGFNGVLTISNQIVADSDALPYKVNGNKIGRLTVRHLSWWHLLTEAVIQHRFRGIKDPDQAWILGELIHYLTDERSGASGFEGMGQSWTAVRDGSRHGTLRPSDPTTLDIAARWKQLVEYLCLALSQELGVGVRAYHPRGRTPTERLTAATRLLAEEGVLRGGLRVPEAVGPIELTADLRSRQLIAAVSLEAPRDLKRPTARINWLLRQLTEAPDDLRIDVRYPHARESCSELLGTCRGDPERLLMGADPKRQPRAFTLARSYPLGRKGGRGDGSLVSDTCTQATAFYRELVQGLRPPRPRAPQLPTEPTAETKSPESEVTARRQSEGGLRQLAELFGYVPNRPAISPNNTKGDTHVEVPDLR